MKSTGIIRKLDELGRITLPMELRKSYRIEEKDPLEIYTDGELIILKPTKEPTAKEKIEALGNDLLKNPDAVSEDEVVMLFNIVTRLKQRKRS